MFGVRALIGIRSIVLILYWFLLSRIMPGGTYCLLDI